MFNLFARSFHQCAFEFGTLEFVDLKSGRRGAAFVHVSGIDVPTCGDFTREDNVQFSGANPLIGHAEGHLCHHRRDAQHKECESGK